jgi:hypothetical protein
MKKRSYEYQKLDAGSVGRGELEIGDKVTPTKELTSNQRKYRLLPGDLYDVKGFLPNVNPYKGGFIIDYEGQDWGLWFGEGGGADNMEKVITSSQDEMEEKYGNFIYKVLSTLKETEESEFLTLEELTDRVLEKLTVLPDKMKKVKIEIKTAIYALEKEGIIGILKFTDKKGNKLFVLTKKGRNYLRG